MYICLGNTTSNTANPFQIFAVTNNDRIYISLQPSKTIIAFPVSCGALRLSIPHVVSGTVTVINH